MGGNGFLGGVKNLQSPYDAHFIALADFFRVGRIDLLERFS